jgi:hypothetical protein
VCPYRLSYPHLSRAVERSRRGEVDVIDERDKEGDQPDRREEPDGSRAAGPPDERECGVVEVDVAEGLERGARLEPPLAHDVAAPLGVQVLDGGLSGFGRGRCVELEVRREVVPAPPVLGLLGVLPCLEEVLDRQEEVELEVGVVWDVAEDAGHAVRPGHLPYPVEHLPDGVL